MIYWDSAATSLYKPLAVGKAMLRAMRECASPGRGGYRASMKAAEVVYSCREAAAQLFRVPSPEQVIITFNATHGLNMAIRSLVRRGDRVVISGYEHNAVVRPLYQLGACPDVVDTPLFDHRSMINAFAEKIPGAAAVVCTHISNVFGYVLPLKEIDALCQRYSVPLIVDASQSAGIQELDFQSLGACYIAMPGHKGLMGPQGTGLLLCRNGGEPLLYGGTGSHSLSPDMPPELPERLEAGTYNVCGIAGLDSAIRYLLKNPPPKMKRREDRLLQQLCDMLEEIDGVRVFRSEDKALQCGVLSIIPFGEDCESWADKLGERGVAVRAGLHCSPLAHQTAGTLSTGTVRFSVSPFNTPEDIWRTCQIIRKI